MLNEMISIIVPVYNNSSELCRCIDSLLSQDYPHIEIIVVDDGSTNQKTLDILSEYERSESLTIVHKNNGGVSSARNTGIQSSQGEYVCFVDADDYASADMCSALVGGMNSQIDAVFGRYDTIGVNGNILSRPEEGRDGCPIGPSDALKLLLRQQPPRLDGAVWRILYRTKFLQVHNINFNEDLVQAEDFDFLLELFQCGARCSIINQVVYHYCDNPNSQTRRYLEGKQASMEKVNARIQAIAHNQKDLIPLYHDSVANTAFCLLGNALLPGNDYNCKGYTAYSADLLESEPYATAIQSISFNNSTLAFQKIAFLKTAIRCPRLLSCILFHLRKVRTHV